MDHSEPTSNFSDPLIKFDYLLLNSSLQATTHHARTIFDCKVRSLLYVLVYGTVLYIITPEGNCTYMPQIGMNNVPNIVVRGGVDVCWQVSSSNNSSSSPLLPLSPTPHPLLTHTHTHITERGWQPFFIIFLCRLLQSV